MDITSENYDQFMGEDGVKLLAFKAPWCGPCRVLGPVLDKISEGDTLVGKVDVDTNKELSAEYSVRSIPTTFIVKGSEIVGKIVGMKSESEILSALAEHN